MIRSRLRSSLSAIFLFHILILVVATAGGWQGLSRQQITTAARDLMTTARYCALITAGDDGRAHARTMDAFPPDENLVVWLATNPRSRKVAEIRRNSRVTLYYFDAASQGYVTLFGRARLVNDPVEKNRHWKEEWKAFYPDREKGYLLIEVTPERLEVVIEKKGIVGNSPTWAPPSVTFKRPKARQ